ncbi:hypothetical protein JYT89_00450 [Flavobacteriaceae bacterium AH-315-B10]|nr:hypothetical protein [Flavobacteriaceae bacterium AH-315-B10]
MKFKLFLTGIILFVTITNAHSQKQNFSFSANVKVDQEVKELFNEKGRLYLFFSLNPRVEPRTQTWPNPTSKTYIFAKNIDRFDSNEVLEIGNDDSWIRTSDWTLDGIPEGEYYVQILWDQDIKESRINAPGNLFSEKKKITVNQSIKMEMTLSQTIEARKVNSHNLSKVIDFKSDTLSKWWAKPVYLKASVLLPYGYDKNTEYPIRYNVAGYGGRYNRINRLIGNKEFMEWWDSDEAPQIITVFLDGEGPFGDSYQMDSENSGPYGYSLINELIPHIESEYRGTNTSATRFVDGCSTGGWVSLGLQLYYPDFFNGVYSYSPDAIDFKNYQLINIYKDKNAFVNEYGFTRPVMRDTYGEPMLSLKEFIQYENVLGTSNSYLNSGGQFSAHTALYSPKGKNDLPKPLFDPKTGVIDSVVAEYWKKYDFKIYVMENWEQLGPKLQGKIFIWMGDMDHFYLNTATRGFDDFIKTTKNPVSDAEIVFSPMEGHCSQYSHKEVLLKIQERINSINKK